METAKGTTTVFEPDRGQQVQARRAAEAKATMPDATYYRQIDVTAAVGDGTALVDALVAALARALRAQPHANAAYKDARFERYSRINVALAVGDGTAITLFDADEQDTAALAARRQELTAKVAAGTITAPETGGGTCSFTDLSDTGLGAFTPLLTPPHAVALGVGSAADPAQVTLALTCDQRVLSPLQAAALLDRIAQELP